MLVPAWCLTLFLSLSPPSGRLGKRSIVTRDLSSYVKLPKAEEAEFESAGYDLLTCSATSSLATVQVVCQREVLRLSLLDY